ncbi:hypothetical protein [Undibacterium flavidum]|nr:hypothetical protein [Undibacterium flavidum]
MSSLNFRLYKSIGDSGYQRKADALRKRKWGVFRQLQDWRR